MSWLTVAKYLLPALLTLGVASYIYLEGRGDERDAVEKQNIEAVADAESAELNFAGCSQRDWMWDFAAGRCLRPESSP